MNDVPTGSVTISGTAQENQVLTASNTLADADGLGAISYQWQRDGINVVGATGGTYALGNADVGPSIEVVAKYTPTAMARAESVTSATTASVTNVNDPPTGSVTISGTAQETQVYERRRTRWRMPMVWARSATSGSVTGSTSLARPRPSYTLGDADVSHGIDVVAKYTDGHGTAEAVTSASTAAVSNVNDAPTGSVTIRRDGRKRARF